MDKKDVRFRPPENVPFTPPFVPGMSIVPEQGGSSLRFGAGDWSGVGLHCRTTTPGITNQLNAMKTLVLTFALIAGSFVTTLAAPALPEITPADSATHKLTVGFTNVAKRTGMMYVGLVNSAADFNNSFYRKTRVEVPATGEFQVSFDGLPAGKYAVQVFQDLNDNMKLDRSGQKPTEPFGFSNVTSLMGPPSFGQSAFDFNASKIIMINLLGL